MDQMDGTICINDRTAIFFKVPLFPARLIAIYRLRRSGDERELWEWLDEGLELALQPKGAEEQLALTLGQMREIDLFCALAANAPDELSGIWYWLWRKIGSDENYWIFPSFVDNGELESEYLEPFLDKDALAADWSALLSAAELRANAHAG